MKDILRYTPENLEIPVPKALPIVEPCKVIPTRDASGVSNGMVVEISKNYAEMQPNNVEGDRSTETTVYMTTVAPDMMKGYHGHTLRTSTYTLIGGEAEVHMLNPDTGELLIYEMNAEETPYRTVTEPGYFLALKSRNNKVATFVGVPNPPYNAKVKEQLELNPELVEQGMQSGQIIARRFACEKDGVRELIDDNVLQTEE